MTNVAYRIVIPGKPIPLARPRLSKFGVYDSQKALKKTVVKYLMQQKDNWQKLDGPIGMMVEFKMPIRKCSKKKAIEIMRCQHVSRPDLSNLIKFIEDAIQGHLFDDDSQIVEITARKVNALVGETIVHLWRLNDDLQNSREDA